MKKGFFSSEAVSWRRLGAGLGVMALACLAYANTLRHPPVWDDHVFVFGQAFLRDCDNLSRVLDPRSFQGVLAARNSARPMWLASVLADTCAGGGLTVVYRLTSVFWHAAASGVVVALAWTLSASFPAALAAGALFAAHPVHAEAVNVVTFRSDVLCLAFLGLALLLYRSGGRRRGWPAAALWAGAFSCAAAALLSKEMAVTLPLLLWLTDAYFPDAAPAPPRRRAALAAAVLLVLCYAVFRAPRSGYAMRSSQDAFSALADAVPLPFSRPLSPGAAPYGAAAALDDPPWARVYADPWARLLTMSRVFGSYARLLLWPRSLQSDYAPSVLDAPTPAVAASWAFWALLVAAAWRLRRRWPLACYGAAWTAASLLPVTGLVALRNLQAERYLYLPSAGFCMAAGALFAAALPSRRRWARPAATALLVALTLAGLARTLRRNRDFSSDAAFFRAVLAADPAVPDAHLALALMASDAGRAEEAEAEFKAALALWPASLKARLLYARFLTSLNRKKEALAQLDLAPPAPGPARLDLERAYREAGRPAARRIKENRRETGKAAPAGSGRRL